MSEENVVRLCAPTLAGIKTGSLFPCPYENRETLLMEIRQYNQELVPKGLCLLPQRFTDKSALQQRSCGTQAMSAAAASSA